jgi:hypothetical protein
MRQSPSLFFRRARFRPHSREVDLFSVTDARATDRPLDDENAKQTSALCRSGGRKSIQSSIKGVGLWDADSTCRESGTTPNQLVDLNEGIVVNGTT